MKKFFTKIKDWFKRHKPTKRRLIQVYAALLYNANIKGFFSRDPIYRGNVKKVCVPGLNCYSCPGASGACPLGALQNALANSGTTAPFYVIGILLLMGLILGRTICGFLCPVGLGQELLYKIKTPKLKKSRYTRIASYLKYVILIVMVIAIPLSFGLSVNTGVPAFCKYICPAGTFGGAIGRLLTPAAGSTLAGFGSLFTWKFALLCVIVVASVFIYRFFCRFFCPLGALYGLFSKIALLGVKLDKNKCTDCGLCLNVCKMDIKRVGDHECIQCGECISACPAKAISWKGSKLFVHQNAVEAGAPVEEKPLNALLNRSEGAAAETVATQTVEVAVTETPEAVAVKKEKKRNFRLQFAAWAVAIAVLIGALVYYNFIDKDGVQTGNKVGDRCSDFTVQLYDGANTQFTLSENLGKVTVINFWATWCQPCVAELPGFNELQKNYADDVLVLAISEDKIADVRKYLNDNGWNEWAIQFAQDTFGGNVGDVYSLLTDKGGYPVTLVLGRDGTIAYNQAGGITYNELEDLVKTLM